VKKLFGLVVLLLIAAGVWLGMRYVMHRGEVRATVVFRSAEGLRAGDPVVEGQTEVGKVTQVARLEGQDAVGIRILRDHRRAVVSDSLFAIEDHRLVVTNTLAVAGPIDDGAVLYAKEDGLSRWLAKHSGKVQPFIEKLKHAADQKLDEVDADHIGAALERWKDEAPDWKKQGRESVDRHLAAIRARVEKLENDLKRSNKTKEARQLKEKFERWVDEVRK
jgi:ABC-type transporter Mla subunit MlaD